MAKHERLMRMTVDMSDHVLIDLKVGDVFLVVPDGDDGASRFEPVGRLTDEVKMAIRVAYPRLGTVVK